MSGELFKNLKLDAWYKVLVYFGGVLFILSLFVPITIEGITNMQIALISLGMFLLGLGEWKNHKYTYWYDFVIVVRAIIRKPDIVGILLDIVGILFIIIGLFDFLGIISVCEIKFILTKFMC